MGVKTVLDCDACGATLSLPGPYFSVKEEMKAKGWKNVKTAEGWKIQCVGCGRK